MLNRDPLTVYGSGFTSWSAAPVDGRKPVDLDAVRLYNQLANRTVNVESWAFRADVMQTALRLMHPFREWLGYQKQNPFLTAQAYGFIADTCQFILEGRRSVSIRTRQSLLDAPANALVGSGYVPFSPNSFYSADVHITRLLSEFQDDAAIMAAWQTHPNGISDLVMTMFVLFGKAIFRNQD